MSFTQNKKSDDEYWVRVDEHGEYNWAEVVKDSVGYSINYFVDDANHKGFRVFDTIDFFDREEAEDELRLSGYGRFIPNEQTTLQKPKVALTS